MHYCHSIRISHALHRQRKLKFLPKIENHVMYAGDTTRLHGDEANLDLISQSYYAYQAYCTVSKGPPPPKCEHLITDMGVASHPPVNKRGLGTRPLLNMSGDVVNSICTQPFYLLHIGGVTSRSLKMGGGGATVPQTPSPPPPMIYITLIILWHYWMWTILYHNYFYVYLLSQEVTCFILA